ncbi:hypothetical protein F5B18DRAFT_597329 [Nemania serpens]|nr:hypothetical protein F5B18DRAFT_597329 [Nemania serpens]
MPLPWLEEKPRRDTSDGMVCQVEMHPSHHNFRPSQSSATPLYFGLIELGTRGAMAYQQSLDMGETYAKIQTKTYPIKPLLTFKHGQDYYILFRGR